MSKWNDQNPEKITKLFNLLRRCIAEKGKKIR